MHRRIAVLFSIWGRILAWCVVAMTVGAILYFLIWDVVTPPIPLILELPWFSVLAAECSSAFSQA